MPKAYKPRTGPGEEIAERMRMLEISNQQAGQAIMALFRERDALLLSLALLTGMKQPENQAVQ